MNRNPSHENRPNFFFTHLENLKVETQIKFQRWTQIRDKIHVMVLVRITNHKTKNAKK
jgi:hypothetical protein